MEDESLLAFLHLALSPLYQAVHFLSFKLAGISLVTSRLFTALCGWALLLVFWWFLRRVIAVEALFLTLTLLAFQQDLLVLSRLAIPEVAIMLVQLLVFFLLTCPSTTSHLSFLGGILLGLGFAVKATVIPFLPIASAIILLVPEIVTGQRKFLPKVRRLLWFWFGFLIPVVAATLVVAFSMIDTSLITWILSVCRDRLEVSSPFSMVSFFFEHPLAETFNLWALGLWLSLLVWGAKRASIDIASKRLLVASAVWFVTYLAVMLTIDYYPTRYKVHILLPMVVNLAVALSLLQQFGVDEIIQAIQRRKRLAQKLWMMLLAAPTAGFLAPMVAAFLLRLEAEPGRLLIKLVSFAVALALVIGIATWRQRSERALRFLLVFPLSAAPLWLGLSTSGLAPSFWPSGGNSTAPMLVFLGLTAVCSAAIVFSRRLVLVRAHAVAIAAFICMAAAPGQGELQLSPSALFDSQCLSGFGFSAC